MPKFSRRDACGWPKEWTLGWLVCTERKWSWVSLLLFLMHVYPWVGAFSSQINNIENVKRQMTQVTRQCLFQICDPVPWVSSILNLGLGFPLPRMGIIIAICVQFTSKDTHAKTHANHSTSYNISEATLPSFPSIVQLDCPPRDQVPPQNSCQLICPCH